jgi:hypothetical protein
MLSEFDKNETNSDSEDEQPKNDNVNATGNEKGNDCLKIINCFFYYGFCCCCCNFILPSIKFYILLVCFTFVIPFILFIVIVIVIIIYAKYVKK